MAKGKEKNIEKTLKKIKKITVPVKIPLDAVGYFMQDDGKLIKLS